MLKKTIVVLLSLIVVAVLALGLILYSRLPDRTGTVGLAGLNRPVDVVFDRWGIPHIKADKPQDAYQALGYLHAQDRLFQIELLKRLSQGRLAEVLGPSLVPVDRLFRTLGLKRHAERWVVEMQDTMEPDMLENLYAYVRGVNQFIEARRLPIEFDLLGIPSQPYTLEDMASITGYMSWSFAQANHEDPVVQYVAQQLGDAYLTDLAISAGAQTEVIPVDVLASVQQGLVQVPGIGTFIGSNGWVLGPRMSASGKVLFVNDPHIGVSQPSAWYEAQLQAAGLDIYGHFLAGLAFPLLGHNRSYAWGMTMFENDDIDFYYETEDADHPGQYRYRDQWLDYEIYPEVISVKDGADVQLDVKVSRHGPIVSNVFQPLDPSGGSIAMDWEFLEPGNGLFAAFYQLQRADTVAKARAAASLIHAPGLNLMYGNEHGDYAWFAAARLPIRPDHVNSKMILDGASGEDDPVGYQAFDRNPQSVNPEVGYVYSANNQPGAVSGKLVPGYFAPRDRAVRIVKFLQPNRRYTSEDMKALLLDDVSETGLALVREMDRLLNRRPELFNAREIELAQFLMAWDGRHNPDAIAPSLYYFWRQQLQQQIFEDDLTPGFYGLFTQSFLADRSLWWILDNPESPWWDDRSRSGRQTKDEILAIGWKAAITRLTEIYGSKLSDWQWHNVAVLEHPHALSKVPLLSKIFSVGPFPANGGIETINNLGFDLQADHFKVRSAPSTRRIIDFADPTVSWGINPTGQSGILMDAHYRDQAQLYADGKFRHQWLDTNTIKQHEFTEMRFVPK
ncbi:penicillin acylase family protein [Gynuella sp.]|uniref:penicillin acylase family protein n=1 Tax=Gynuella sp. TaxID=2969146 RepID=UPI003D132ACD